MVDDRYEWADEPVDPPKITWARDEHVEKKREWLESQIRERVALIDATYRDRIERAIAHGWIGEIKRQFHYRQRDVDLAIRSFLEEYAKLPIPPVIVEIEIS